ncbi:hypothetical protein ACHQM5_012823 [Ranunculus cassubicifolius]
MGQSMKKLANGVTDETKAKEIGPIIEECYTMYFADPNKIWTLADFYRAVCQTVEEINKKIEGTQFRVPRKEVLEKAFKEHHQGKGKSLTKKEFREIMREVIFDTGLLGTGSKDIILFIFGIPMVSLFIKKTLAPNAVRNEVFIPCVTSATVFVLAKLNKL